MPILNHKRRGDISERPYDLKRGDISEIGISAMKIDTSMSGETYRHMSDICHARWGSLDPRQT